MIIGNAPVEAEEPFLLTPYIVGERYDETDGTVTLHLDPADGLGMEYQPGQFNMLYVFGMGEVPISIAGGMHGELIHTVRSVGPVTDALCALNPGDQIGVRGPYGAGWPLGQASGRDVVMVAGGIGLAPLRQLVVHLVEHRELYGAISLIYGARSPEDLLYEQDLHAWRSRFDFEVEVTVDRGSDQWRGDVGVVTPLLGRIDFDPSNVTAMVCGPEVMMRVIGRALEERGVDAADIWISLERNMKCAVGFCGHCQFGPEFVCKDGPVVPFGRVADLMAVSEL